MSGDYMEEAPTTAVRASLRDLLQAQVAALEITPKWLWEIEFSLHIWPILERFYRDGDKDARDLVSQLSSTLDVFWGVRAIKDYLGPTKPEPSKPW